MNTIINLFIGAAVGYLAGQILLVFFEKEIMGVIDRIVNKVRGWFGLRPQA